MSKKLIFRVLIGLLVVLIGIQFIRPDRSTPDVLQGSTFVDLSNTPAEIVDLLEVACYDCHSYNTQYPWYANVAPVSWWIESHVEEGREHFNFSRWGTYTLKERLHKLDEAIEEVREGHMPLDSYTWMHPKAKLSDAQRDQLIAYFIELKSELQDIPPLSPEYRPGIGQ